MMKRLLDKRLGMDNWQPSFRLVLILMLLVLGGLMALAYSQVSTQYFFRGMDTVLASDMRSVMQGYLELRTSPTANQRVLASLREDYRFADEWQQLPEDFQQHFSPDDLVPNHLQVFLDKSDAWKGPKRVLYLMLYQEGDRRGYIARILVPPEDRSQIHAQRRENQRILLLVGLASIVVMALAGVLMLFWLSRPGARLVNWTRSLTPESLQQPRPAFGYRELDELAAIIADSFRSLQEAAEREEAFLRHTSHELRTPIAVVRSNSALLKKLLQRYSDSQTSEDARLPDAAFDALSRLERAGLSMSHVTNTLLWLGRDDEEDLPVSHLDLGEVIKQIVEELSYLLDNKSVQIELHTESYKIDVAEMPLRIVLGNLIRNAFQHTWSGTVEIRQSGTDIHIDNHNDADEAPAEGQDDLGFGLGLKLTERLTQRLKWQYENRPVSGGHRVVLKLGSTSESSENP